MKLTVRCRSGLRIDFEGDLAELERFDGFLAELARLERARLAPSREFEPTAASSDPATYEPFLDPEPPSAAPTEPRREKQPGSGRRATTAPVVLQAVQDLGVTTVPAICEHTGLTAKAVQNVLYRLKDQGAVVHNGERGPASRWYIVGTEDDTDTDTDRDTTPDITPVVRRQQSPHEGRVIGASARAAMDAQRDARHDGHHDQVIALVAEHGPVAPAWVADQLVKNRRDTAALMRDMAAAGELVEQDAGGYDIPDRDDQDLAA